MGAEKIFGGAQLNFRSNSGVKTKKKKVFIPKRPVDMGRLPPFVTLFLLERVYVHCLAGRDGLSWCVSRFLPTNSGVKPPEKVLQRDILGLVLAFTCVFCPETRLNSRLGEAHAGGGHTPHPVAPGLCCPRNRICHCFVSFANT